MADLKIGTTIGGSAIWTKGTLPLVPSSNTLTYNGYKIYSEYDKPTPAELGVYAKSETYTKTEIEQLGKIRVLDIRNTNKTPSEYPGQMLSTFFNTSSVSGALPLTATWYSGFTVRGWTDGYVSWQMASMSHTGASDNKLWFRASQNDTTWGAWGRIYTEFDKPTASDVRALPVSGQALNDTALGVRRLGKTIAFEISQDQIPNISVDFAYQAVAFNPVDKAASFPAQVFLNGNKRVLSEADYNTSSSWSSIINKLPLITSTGVMEVGKYIDFHDTNSTKDYDVRVTCVGSAGSECLNIRTTNGEVEIGAKNDSAAHFYTDRGFIAFNKRIDVAGGITANGTLDLRGGDIMFDAYNARRSLVFLYDPSGESVNVYVEPTKNKLSISSPITFVGSFDVNAANGSGSHFNLRNWGNSSAGRANVFECGDQFGWHWYTQRATNVAGGAINFSINGTLNVGGQMTARESVNTTTRSFRSAVGRFGSFWHNDSMDNLYLMFTAEGDLYGGWSSLRPMTFNMRNGHATFSHGISSGTGFHLPTNVSITWNAGGNWAGGIGWGLQEESSSGDMILHKYSSGQWQSAPFRFKNDHTFECAGNGNFNDVYIRSDKRLKSNIELTTNHLEKILQLKPVAYDKKATLDADTTERELGLIAQDVEKIIPLAVGTGSDEHKLKALKPYALIATLIGAIQEQQKQIDSLKSMITNK